MILDDNDIPWPLSQHFQCRLMFRVHLQGPAAIRGLRDTDFLAHALRFLLKHFRHIETVTVPDEQNREFTFLFDRLVGFRRKPTAARQTEKCQKFCEHFDEWEKSKLSDVLGHRLL